jgi:hypothetical protein
LDTSPLPSGCMPRQPETRSWSTHADVHSGLGRAAHDGGPGASRCRDPVSSRCSEVAAKLKRHQQRGLRCWAKRLLLPYLVAAAEGCRRSVHRGRQCTRHNDLAAGSGSWPQAGHAVWAEQRRCCQGCSDWADSDGWVLRAGGPLASAAATAAELESVRTD